jgi:hypothetical protein
LNERAGFERLRNSHPDNAGGVLRTIGFGVVSVAKHRDVSRYSSSGSLEARQLSLFEYVSSIT